MKSRRFMATRYHIASRAGSLVLIFLHKRVRAQRDLLIRPLAATHFATRKRAPAQGAPEARKTRAARRALPD
jgi:hypothetical protein